jgi:hypothetical protein
MTDDNCGKLLRKKIYDQYDSFIEKATTMKLTSSEIRTKLIEWSAFAAQKWNQDMFDTIGKKSLEGNYSSSNL